MGSRIFVDDDKRVYLYWGSSNFYPLYGQEIDRQTLQPIGEKKNSSACMMRYMAGKDLVSITTILF